MDRGFSIWAKATRISDQLQCRRLGSSAVPATSYDRVQDCEVSSDRIALLARLIPRTIPLVTLLVDHVLDAGFVGDKVVHGDSLKHTGVTLTSPHEGNDHWIYPHVP